MTIGKSIAAAFVKAQKGFAPALKTSTNPHFKSKYADLSACVEAVIDSLNDNGISLVQMTHDTESGVKVETVLIHESGETISSGILHVPASKQDPQGYGSALTYARRYSLMAACGIAPEDDDGNYASKLQENPVKREEKSVTEVVKKRMSIDQVIAIEDEAKANNVEIADILNLAKVSSLEQISADRFDGLIDWIKKGGKK